MRASQWETPWSPAFRPALGSFEFDRDRRCERALEYIKNMEAAAGWKFDRDEASDVSGCRRRDSGR